MAEQRIWQRGMRVASLHGMAFEECAGQLIASGDLAFSDDELADLDLCNALLEVEHYCRERQWEALEALLPLIPPGGDVSEVVHLPRPLAVRATHLAMRCGWFWDCDDRA
jgi:hypothetical protein